MTDRLPNLVPRIAAALGWTEPEVRQFSFQSLREIVRPVSPKLAHELDVMIRTGEYIVGPSGPARSSFCACGRRRCDGTWPRCGALET